MDHLQWQEANQVYEGGVLNLTEGRISQILGRALSRLRQAVADDACLSERL